MRSDPDGRVLHPPVAFAPDPRKVPVAHGEPDAADALRVRVEHETGWPAQALEYPERVDLD
jgi:metallo-beta-lactamase family protein